MGVVEQSMLSIFSNVGVGLTMLLAGMFIGVLWFTRGKRMLRETFLVSGSLGLIMLAGFLRIFPWGVGMWMALPGERYHPMLIDNRDLTYGPSMPLFLIGIVGLLYVIFPKRIERAFLLGGLFLTISVAALAAVSWGKSEQGEWFDRPALVERIERAVGYKRTWHDNGLYHPIEDCAEIYEVKPE